VALNCKKNLLGGRASSRTPAVLFQTPSTYMSRSSRVQRPSSDKGAVWYSRNIGLCRLSLKPPIGSYVTASSVSSLYSGLSK
jgi:hypothetical protein